MATTKVAENDYSSRKAMKVAESTVSRRTKKLKSSEPMQVVGKKLTRAKTRTGHSDDTAPNQSSVNKTREKGKIIGDILKDAECIGFPQEVSENTISPKKDSESLISPKKDVVVFAKKEIMSQLLIKKDSVSPGSPKKDGENVISPKKEVLSKRDAQSIIFPIKEIQSVSPKKDTQGNVSSRKEMLSYSPKKDTQSIVSLKQEMLSLSPKKDTQSFVSPKEETLTLLQKKDVQGPAQKKEVLSLSPKKESQTSASFKKDEVSLVKSRKVKTKLLNTAVPEKKQRDDSRSNYKSDEVKLDVIPTDKVKNKDDKTKNDKKERSISGKPETEKNREIMNSDVTSSVDDKLPQKLTRNQSPAAAAAAVNTKESGWSPGDLAWGRVGQHPFWPCMIAIDHQTGQFIKTRRVGRGLNSVHQRLHVQFFGDNGRHSWLSTTSVIKYQGKQKFQTFAEKVLQEMKKKDKRYTSAFIVKQSSKTKWEIAIGEAETTVSKTSEERIKFFQELLTVRKATEKTDTEQESVKKEEPKVQLVRKRKRPNPIVDAKPTKQTKMSTTQMAVKDAGEKKKVQNTNSNTPTRKKRGRNKIMKKRTGVF